MDVQRRTLLYEADAAVKHGSSSTVNEAMPRGGSGTVLDRDGKTREEE